MTNPLKWLINRLHSGSARSVLLKRNMLFALLIKAGSIFCTLFLVPATIDFVNPIQYGIWLTISSIVAWMSFFDVGFSNGLRNKLVEALAANDTRKGQSLVSTTYFILTLIFAGAMLLTIPMIWLFDVAPLLNLDASYESDLKLTMSIVVVYFCVSFVLRTLSYVLMADQRNSYSSFIEFMGQLTVLVTILCIKDRLHGSLTTLAIAQCVPPVLVWAGASLFHYTRRYRDLRPSWSHIRMAESKHLMGLGIKFFIIQIAALIQFQTANILIARLYSMGDVTDYNIAYKYFNVLYMCFFLLLQPFWSAVTDAYAKQDIQWIVSAIRKYLYLFAGTFLAGMVMLVASPYIYQRWIGDTIHIDFALSGWMFIYFMSLIFGAIFCFFVNGIGALKIQYISSLISPLVFVGTVLWLSKGLHMGMQSILIASVVANFNGLILAPLQYRMVIHHKKQGIWTS